MGFGLHNYFFMSKNLKMILIVLSSILAACIIALCIVIPINAPKIRVTASFEDLDLYTKRLPVYYRGFKLGRVIKIYLAPDSKTTLIDMRLKLRGAELPDNVVAKIRNKKKKDYIEIVYPKVPSEGILENGALIEGCNGFDISTYIDKQADSGSLDEIKENLNKTVEAAGETLNALTGLITIGTEILQDIRPAIKESSENFAKTTKHLELAADKLNKSTDSKKFSNSTFNIEQTTKNIEIATNNLAQLSEKANNQTLGILDSTLNNFKNSSGDISFITNQIKCILKHTEDIVRGLKITLSNRFSGMKIMFGKAIE